MMPFVIQHLSSTYSLEKTVHGKKKKKKQDVEEHETVITLSSDKMLI